MCQITKDVSKVWDRIFKQSGFINGEINFTLKEFETKRSDSEVDNLFKSIENITDIKDTQINSLSEIVNEKVVDTNQYLNEALKLCREFGDLEKTFLQQTVSGGNNDRRKDLWEKIMDEITSEFSKVNSDFERKEIEAVQYYKELGKKLK
ncbi:unnamed protein product [Ceutorhynchus assimilis]|uniref:Biogenesis of lysosome-related organelles complex 1 subunit 5 n=1 Tax=Ceutorhynchus assimilis TaxID=467358 RepID=A0A9N9MBD0_9CUCU|nr:unnamed protein product [Ceutorhynchus assimilis]